MLEFILGAAGSGKTALLYDRLKNSDGERLLIVPDQYVFETERIIAEITDEKTNGITVTGFSSLAEKILKKYCPRKNYADDTAKTAVMTSCVRAVRDELCFYGKAAYKDNFAQSMLSAVSELKTAGINSDLLSALVESAEGSFKNKLTDISIIYRLYNDRLREIYDDRQDDCVLAARAAEEFDCFAGVKVFIDGFDSFSGSQQRLLAPVVRQSENCTVALCLDNGDAFAVTENTRQFFIRTAELEHSEIKQTVLDGAPRYLSHELLHLRNALARGEEKPCSEQASDIVTAYAASKSEEADYVCANIKKLVKTGYRYSDIAVLCTSPSDYESVVCSAARRYGIPLFADLPKPVSDKPLLKYLTLLLSAAENPNGEKVLRYMKSGFVRIPSSDGRTKPLSLKQINDLESYVFTYELKKRSWARSFPKSKAEAENKYEDLRQAVVNPLCTLAKSMDGKTGREMTGLFVKFLFETADITTAIKGKCQDYTTRELKYDKQLTEEYNQLWGIVCRLFDSLYETAGDTAMTIGEYVSLIKACAAKINMSRPPKVLDSVLFGDPERTRSKEVKAVFVMGASEGKFPAEESGDMLFTDDERRLLCEKSGVDIGENPDLALARDALCVYKALTLGREKLFVTYTGGVQDKSESVSLINSLFGIQSENISLLSPLYFCESIDSARKQLVRCRFEKSKESYAGAVALALKNNGDTDFLKRVQAAIKRLGEDAYIHKIGDTAPLIFPPKPLSPTALNLLNGCRFAYFCKYGLKIREPFSIGINSANFGTIIHYIFKYTLERMTEIGKGNYADAPCEDEDIARYAQEAVALYRKEFLLDEQDTSNKFNRLYENIKNISVYMLKFMLGEMKKSKFKPAYFELKLADGSKTQDGMNTSPFSFDITLPDGQSRAVTIQGIADRVDIAEIDGKKQLKIVDYKSGAKGREKPDITKIYYGLDLQLLIYLFALTESNDGCIPSAAVYIPVGNIPGSEEIQITDEQKRDYWMSENNETGFSIGGTQYELERPNYDSVLNKDKKKNYCSAVTIGADKIDKLKARMKKIVGDNVCKTVSGDVSAEPLTDKAELISCEYCQYADICGVNPDKAVETDSIEACNFADDVEADIAEAGAVAHDAAADSTRAGKSANDI